MASVSNPERHAHAARLVGGLVLGALVNGVLLGALLLGCTATASSAAPSNAVNQSRLDNTVRYLQDAQNMDGGFGGNAGAPSDPDFSAWAALALAAAGINPQDQARPGGIDAYAYLAEHASGLTFTTDLDRALLVADASGTSPQDFGGVDLVGEVLRRQLSGAGKEGAFPHESGGETPGVNDTIFAVLALSPIAEPAVQSAVQRAADWIAEAQNGDGGWPETTVCTRAASECLSDVDVTGAAIQALNAAGRHSTHAQEKAFAYLHETQDANGGFPEHIGESEPNVVSTAWSVQGMWSAAQNPETMWTVAQGEPTDDPLGYLASLQQPDGHIRWRSSTELNGLWVTAEVAPAFAGQPLPIPPVPLEAETPPAPADAGTAAGSPGLSIGGESSQPGGGVIADGGGDGAALFSRPQPQSRGNTPGGPRLLSRPRSRPAHERPSTRRPAPGAPRKTPAHLDISTNAPAFGSSSANRARAGGTDVTGVLIAAPDEAARAAEAGAPGLRSAGAGKDTQWLAIGIACTIAVLLLAGSQLERKRPQMIL